MKNNDNRYMNWFFAALLILLVVLFAVSFAAEAQSEEELEGLNALSFSVSCRDESNTYINASYTDWTYQLIADFPNGASYEVVSPLMRRSGLAVPIAFNSFGYSHWVGNATVYDDFTFDEAPECHQDYEPFVQHNECLGIPYEGEGLFFVDNNPYYYNGHLSFMVPEDALWEWVLYIDNEYVLTFAQSETEACRITHYDD